MQRVHVPAPAELGAEAPGVAATTRRAEHNSAVGQIGGHHVVVRAARQLAQSRSVHVHFKDVVKPGVDVVGQRGRIALPVRLDVRKHDPPGVVRQPGLQHVAAGQPPVEDVPACQRSAGVVQHEDSAPGPRTPAEVLHDEMTIRRRHSLGKQQLAELQQRVGQHDPPLQPANLLVESPGTGRRW